MVAYKVIDYNDGMPRTMSAHIYLPMTLTEYEGIPLFFSLQRQYVLDYYRGNEIDILLTVSFNPKDVENGNLTDNETEFTLFKFEVIKKEKFTLGDMHGSECKLFGDN